MPVLHIKETWKSAVFWWAVTLCFVCFFLTVWDDGEFQDTVQCDQGALGHKPSAGYFKFLKDDWDDRLCSVLPLCVKALVVFLSAWLFYIWCTRKRETECACVGACVCSCVWMRLDVWCHRWIVSINVVVFLSH